MAIAGSGLPRTDDSTAAVSVNSRLAEKKKPAGRSPRVKKGRFARPGLAAFRITTVQAGHTAIHHHSCCGTALSA